MYTPFKKDHLALLESADLADLRHAAEGWYIEYKQECLNASSIAKSVSAFANTYGGWLFYGVVQKSKEDPVADTFPGIAREDMDAALQRIRQAVAVLLAPSPHFDCRPLWGPCDSIGLSENRAIICIRVSQSNAAPHVHKSGQIYRRVADGSEPRPENDRFILDQLWHRADALRSNYRKWIEKDPELSEQQKTDPYVRLLLVPNLWFDQEMDTQLSLSDARNILGRTTGEFTIPLDTVFYSSGGFIGRQHGRNDPRAMMFTWRLYNDLASDIFIPLYSYSIEGRLPKQLAAYNGAKEFVQMLLRQGHTNPRVLDLNFLFHILIGVIETQHELFKRTKWTHGYHFKARFINCGLASPFLDVSDILKEFDEHGIPICLDNVITTPPGVDPESFEKNFVGEQDMPIPDKLKMEATWIFDRIVRGFGVPPPWELEKRPAKFYEELVEAGGRGILGYKDLK